MKALTYLQYANLDKGKKKYKIQLGLNWNDEYGLIEFYDQTFTPELITKHFEGFKKSKTSTSYHIGDVGDGFINIYFSKIAMELTAESGFKRFPCIPNTLDDFILFCQYAGIELEFKEVE